VAAAVSRKARSGGAISSAAADEGDRVSIEHAVVALEIDVPFAPQFLTAIPSAFLIQTDIFSILSSQQHPADSFDP
jgi:hypothetical protein